MFDAVVAGQAWHWVDPVAGAAKAAQVLRPGGRLVVFWNAFDAAARLADAFNAVYQRVLPGSPISLTARDAYPTLAAMAADGMRGVFAAPEEWRFDWEHDLHPRRVARRRCRRSAATPCSPPTSGPRCWRGSGRRSTRSAAGSSCATRRWRWRLSCRCASVTSRPGWSVVARMSIRAPT